MRNGELRPQCHLFWKQGKVLPGVRTRGQRMQWRFRIPAVLQQMQLCQPTHVVLLPDLGTSKIVHAKLWEQG